MNSLLPLVKRHLRSGVRAGFRGSFAFGLLFGLTLGSMGCASAPKQTPPTASQPTKAAETKPGEDEKNPTFNDLRGYIYPARNK